MSSLYSCFPLLRTGLLGLCALIAFGLSGCATQSAPPAPAHVSPGAFEYLLGPGDRLNIVVWRNPELSGSFDVRPDGRLTTPLVEDVEAVNKTATQLAREIEKRLSKYLQDPVVSVMVQGFVGPDSQQVKVIGQATTPKAIPYREKMTLLDVMIAVGGLTDFAAGNQARIMRARDGNKLYSVRIHDLIKRGDLGANVEMLPGDVVVIPEAWF